MLRRKKIANEAQIDVLKQEVVVLFNAFHRVKNELASIKHPSNDEDLLGSVSEQLAAISEETSSATNEIMEASEAIQEVNDRLMAEIKFKGATPNFEVIGENVNRIFEACTFHDITGQRLNKIITAINMLEESLNALVVTIGKDALESLPVEQKSIHHDDEGLELAGPQVGGPEFSQDDIDKLFD